MYPIDTVVSLDTQVEREGKRKEYLRSFQMILTSKPSTARRTYKIILEHIASSKPWCKDERVIDETDDLGHARYLRKEYQFIYGSTWKVRYEC